jgi:ADP-L-glycero-D-manno-heptose 6-epimerase
MIIITGGAGMIGSMIAWQLNQQGRDDLLIVDDIQHEEQWQNLVKRHYLNYLDKSELACFLAGKPKVDAIIHMGAISATVERDFNKLVQNNIRFSQLLWDWCSEHQVPFLYASSAATYGAGELGYDDSQIDALRPLNGYGYSKHFFDQWALQQAARGHQPPQWQGFKFFNVYGPNEYHKQRMASVAFHSFHQARSIGLIKLFKSHHADYQDGKQLRDFVYVKDAAAVVVHAMQQRSPSGIYNLGTGQARSFLDLAHAVMNSMGVQPNVEFIEMPEDLRGRYQYFTQANMQKLSQLGYTAPFHSLEQGVADYVQNYLMQQDPYC